MRAIAKIGYGVGQLSEGVKQAAFNTFLFFYYNQVLGLSGSLAGAAALLALVVDAFTDPMIGQISDHWKSKWGRRHPFMLLGAIPFGLAIVALFSPPEGLADLALFSWMLGWAIIVRLALTFFYVPHLSLGAELVSDYHERTSLIGYRVFFSFLGILLTSVIGFAVFFSPSEAYSNGLLNPQSYPAFAVFCAILGSSAMLISTASTVSAIPHLHQPPVAKKNNHPALAFIEMFKTLKQRSFRVLFSVIVLVAALQGSIQALLVYMATFVFGFSPEHLAGLFGGLIIGILFSSFTAQYLSKRFDKRRSLTVCMTLGCCFTFTPAFLYLAGVLPVLDIDIRFFLVLIANGVSQIFFIAYTILLDSMLSDTIDEHELTSSKREEGLFFAARSFAGKASFGLGTFFAGIGLDVIKFPQAATLENIPPEAVTSLAVFGGPVLFVLFLSTILVSRRFPLDEAQHQQILLQIAERKQANS
jgi:Na+/melibiose symporter-like transporter